MYIIIKNILLNIITSKINNFYLCFLSIHRALNGVLLMIISEKRGGAVGAR